MSWEIDELHMFVAGLDELDIRTSFELMESQVSFNTIEIQVVEPNHDVEMFTDDRLMKFDKDRSRKWAPELSRFVRHELMMNSDGM